MGWTYIHKEPGQSIFEVMKEEFPGQDTENRRLRLIDCACPNPREAYLAFEDYDKKSGRREVFAVVCLLDYDRNSYWNFGYKAMEETTGPVPTNCPERILKLLTPTDNETARRWREACWRNVERRKRWRRVGKGDLLVFDRPVRFANGEEKTRLVVVDKRRRWFHDPKDRITRYIIDRRTLLSADFRVESAASM